MLNVMDNSTHDEHLRQQIQTNINLFRLAIAFTTGYHGTINVTNSNTNFLLVKSISDRDGFLNISMPPGA